ncbi:LOW QUALITY PROTEIN: hypothetical protein HZS_5251 [Henneguya salminicola]|nr:LOW QUALITY PROTEIN: hypothetical protein HZS_5251 [Henneguya salminicola]
MCNKYFSVPKIFLEAIKRSIYQKLHNTIIYFDTNNILISSAKFFGHQFQSKIDDTLLIHQDDCLKLYKNNIEKASFDHTNISIYFIDDSRNGEFIIGCERNDMRERKI